MQRSLQWRLGNLKIFFQQDNARPHTARFTRQFINEKLGWECVVHPPYSPDVAPSDFHLFKYMSHGLKNVVFKDETEMRIWVE